MEFSESGQTRGECPDLPVSWLIALHALRLECEKSMELTASSHRSCVTVLSKPNMATDKNARHVEENDSPDTSGPVYENMKKV